MRSALPSCYGIARLAAGVLFLGALLSGCAVVLPQSEALRQGLPAGLASRTELADVPFFPQQDYQCGPAALAMTMNYSRLAVTPEELASQVYLPARRGSLQVEMQAAPRRFGLVSYPLAPRYADLLREVAAGNPVIVLQDYGVWPFSIWHYAVVVGYDYGKSEVTLRSGEKKRLTMPFPVLEYTWKESGYWAMVALPPDRIPATATEPGYLSAIAAMERVAKPAATRTAYATFLRRWPDNVTASIGLANSLYALGDLAEAEAVLRRAASRHPDSVAVLNNLAQVLSDRGRNAEAAKLIDVAAALGGELAPAVKETQTLIRQRLGEKTGAR